MGLTLVGSRFTLTTADRVLQEGDSISALDTSTQVLMQTKRRLFQLADQNPTGPRPLWWNTAISSTNSAAQLLRMQAGVGKYKPTKILWIFGTAPLLLADPIGTVNDQVTTTILGCYNLALNFSRALSIPIYVGSIRCLGEKWPTGQNVSDTSVDLLVSGLATISANFTDICSFRDLRSTVYAVYEPILNVANTTMGPLCRPDVAGVHDNPGGRGINDSVITGDFNIVAATTPTTGTILYSGSTLPNASSAGLDFDPVNTGVGDGVNVTTWANAGVIGSAGNLVTTPGTKPVMRLVAQAGKINNASGVQSAGAAWIRAAAFTARAQPMMTAMLWQSTNITANQILYDGNTGTQEPSLATIATTGVVEPNAGTPLDQAAIAAGKWNLCIVYWAGNNSGSFAVLNGVMGTLGNMGTNSRSGLTLFASASSGLIATGIIARFVEWHSTLGTLPKWQDVEGYFETKYGGQFPQ
jgi:hypothetical protein